MSDSKFFEPINYNFASSINMDVRIEQPAKKKSAVPDARTQHLTQQAQNEISRMKVKEAYEARYAAYKIERDNGKNDDEISEIIGLSARTLKGNHYHYRYNKEKRIESKA
ncbi:hypothetical protein K1728_00695 [Weissella confusa]|uniref:hypothetical protein n=1 Tax=Weissella confusa TaxID=1583 RepID=UPI001C6F8D7A|nr:hypothetical protein [Weissella confusa]QYU57963.1 hypothetical protein K1728_00695 [Weissella confusa]